MLNDRGEYKRDMLHRMIEMAIGSLADVCVRMHIRSAGSPIEGVDSFLNGRRPNL